MTQELSNALECFLLFGLRMSAERVADENVCHAFRNVNLNIAVIVRPKSCQIERVVQHAVELARNEQKLCVQFRRIA